jgi:hypothetical protein
VRNGFHADIPRLIVDITRAARAHMAGGKLDLIRECGGDQELGKDRVRIQRNRRQKIVQLFRRKRDGEYSSPRVLRRSEAGGKVAGPEGGDQEKRLTH